MSVLFALLKREKWSVASEQGVPFELTVPLKILVEKSEQSLLRIDF